MNKKLFVFRKKEDLNFDLDKNGNYRDKRVKDYKPYDEEYYYKPKQFTYEKAVQYLIALKYSVFDELGLINQKQARYDEYAVYYQYREQCKVDAKEFIEIKENW